MASAPPMKPPPKFLSPAELLEKKVKEAEEELGEPKRKTSPEELGEGEWFYSASQIDTFRDCRRKWAINYIFGYPKKRNKYAAAGDRIHGKLEDYLAFGRIGDHEMDDDVKIILPGLKHLPRPGTAHVEQHFDIMLPGLGAITGFIDFEHLGDDGIPVVGDHKTTSNFKWAMDEQELKQNVQSVIYAVRTMEKYGVDRTRNRWIYYLRNPKKPRAKPVEATMELADVAKHWESVLGSVKEMKALHDAEPQDVKDVPFDSTACDKYGGCPFKGTICKLSPADSLRSFIVNQSMKDRMKAAKAKKEAAAQPAEEPAEEAAPAPVNPPAQAATGKANPLQRLKKKKGAGAAKTATPAEAPAPEEQPPPPPPVQVASAEVTEFTVAKGMTTDLGDFESAKVYVSITARGNEAGIEVINEKVSNILVGAIAEFHED